MMTAIRAMNSLSTALLSIFMLNMRPIVLPITAETIIRMSIFQSKDGTVVVMREVKREKTWEKNITKREAMAELLVSREKK